MRLHNIKAKPNLCFGVKSIEKRKLLIWDFSCQLPGTSLQDSVKNEELTDVLETDTMVRGEINIG